MKKINIDLKIIGIVNSQYNKINEIPKGKKLKISEIIINKEFKDGLKDIEGFSHLHIYYLLHKSKEFNLQTITHWDDKLHGIFSTRSPNRPNPIAHTIVELISINDRIIKIKDLDAIDKTPILDIKPYIKKIDIKIGSFSGWLENKY